MSTFLKILSLSILFCYRAVSFAAEPVKLRLFDSYGAFVQGYNTLMEEIVSGRNNFTHLQFSKSVFPFKGYLGSGGTTVIVDVGGGKALRLARSNELPMECDDEAFRVDRDRLRDYMNTASKLADNFGLPVPRVWPGESQKSANYLGELEYVMVEKMSPAYTLSEFLAKIQGFSHTERSRHLEALKKIAVKACKISAIRDLHGDNIAWDSEKEDWVIMDFGRDIVPYLHTQDQQGQHIFSTAGLPPAWKKAIGQAVMKKRALNDPGSDI